ncbi:sulfatase family protein [Humisphaera borealis]|uniref:Sulfatase-like hydrolase/transferase n=1 Tax=Humisphaera borealis TaxID=2807512 RepID=A0A7M2X0J9_9BACT|nr:sulfatase-like hydrolase/transferase [Humisphaera borealis]QOV91174.1 sulfatase-like hydrolase/transferase [Humisphaera borealis]
MNGLHPIGTQTLPRFALLLGFVVCLAASARAADAPPNILLIYSDDHGWADLGAQGVNGDIRTPNLDQFAKDGVRFARGYVTAPQCVPSRAGVLTGRYQQRFGVEDNNKGPLPLAEVTIAERLKAAGYISGQVGKWHLDHGGEKGAGEKGAAGKAAGMLREHMPHGQGFDEYFRGERGQYYASHDLKGQPLADAPQLITDNRFRVVVQTDAAISFLDRRSAKPQQPWFLYLAWFAPHVPLESAEPWFSKTPERLPLVRRQALSMIAGMDDGLGRIRRKLAEMGVEKNTLIFFIGDNGAPLKTGAWNGSVNLPLIGEKGMLTDGGIRTPFVAAWPGKLAAGQVYEHPVSSLDVAATAAALAGLPKDDKLDGVNLIPYLTGQNKAAPHEALYWRWRSQAAVLEMPWKLVALGPTERYLFDVTQPDGETKNLLKDKPEVASRLEAKLKAWSAGLNPPGLPTEVHPQDQFFFEDHRLSPKPAGAAVPTAKPADDWLCRNGTLAVRDGAMSITPDTNAAKNARVFIAKAGLEVPGPVTMKLLARAKRGGASNVTWRLNGQKDFLPEQSASFDWPAGDQWREVKVELPASGKLIHLRITPDKDASGLEIRSIELVGKDGARKIWSFGPANPAE